MASDEVYIIEETLVQVLSVILLSPLYQGIYEKAVAKVQGRKGQSIFQPYYDIKKLLAKEVLVPTTSSDMFIYSPYIVFSIYLTISFVIPVVYPEPVLFTPTVDFLGGALLFSLAAFIKVLASMESGSNFVALSASRILSFTFLSEATLITVFFGVAIITGTNNPYVTLSYLTESTAHYLSLTHIFISISFFMLWLFETGKLPVESSGLSELGMIDDGLLYEYSGKLLALLKWGSYLKQYLLGSVLLNVFIFPWFMETGPLGAIEDVGVMFAKWLLLILIAVIINTTLAKLRLFKVQDFLAVAFLLSFFSLILTVLPGGAP
ncbi:respiratory chain complex I subunit 1 family protein [Stygiolobus caldivivus]|uniref:Hydrogenase n=1 Tax=Stygiolobus caldivivus TaxID=2824673 RepID=A0A8D5ZI34_9CREN|nr:respiratory chain complex I subunit 1 family protein [Stygiolobus caldivivus]BCU70259.1 hydrogenase [Stygiolobus caldivivus]